MQRKRDGKFVLIDFGVAKRLMETGKPGTKWAPNRHRRRLTEDQTNTNFCNCAGERGCPTDKLGLIPEELAALKSRQTAWETAYTNH
ncbi:MAG: hypothetical protein GDA43_25270 [Hormoscilla sp. SP5CHS1]|nr:hypothetical protein [Hormoscilla sp. SP5CHS1]